LTFKEANWKCGDLPKKWMEAFNLLKSFLTSEPVVEYARKHRPYSLIVAASMGTGLGAMLCLTDEEGEERVSTYASRQLLKHERNYTPFW
jgi:hypothetical protein